MVRTDQAYINEYLVYDEVFEACEACERACVEADYFMMKQARRDYLDAYFSEALNFGKKPQQEETNIFAKLGKAIVTLLNKIRDFIRKITDAILGTQRRTAKANSAIQKIIADNPELKNKILKGVKKEWFTIYDVAAYKNDVIGLINMMDQAKIDNATAMDKFKEATAKLGKGTMTALAGTGGVLGAIKCIGEITKSRDAISKTSKSLENMTKVVQSEVEKAAKEKGQDPNGFRAKATTKVRILSGAIQVLIGYDKKYNDAVKNLETVVDKASQTNTDNQSQIKKDAGEAFTNYLNSVDKLVDVAAQANSSKDSTYTAARQDCRDAYQRITKHYKDNMEHIDNHRFVEFLTSVGKLADQHDTRTDININDIKNDGKFIKLKS